MLKAVAITQNALFELTTINRSVNPNKIFFFVAERIRAFCLGDLHGAEIDNGVFR